MGTERFPRIVLGITELDIGGAEKSMVQLALGLKRRGWDVHVHCLAPWGPLATTLREADIPVTTFDACHFWDMPRVLGAWRSSLKRLQPDILHTFLFHANLLGRIAGRLAGVPVRISGIRVAERRSPLYGWLDRATNSLVQMNVCVSQGVADFCRDVVGLSPEKLTVIPNGVDGDRLATADPIDLSPWGLTSGTPYLLGVGRLEPQKGFDLLIKAFVGLPANLTDVQLFILGEGPDRPLLEGLVESLQLTGRVHLPGRRNDVPRWLRSARGFVLSSRWEGMANVVLEAMAAGTPVIATEVEGAAELLQGGTNGLVVPPENISALTAGMRELLDGPGPALQRSQIAQQYITNTFTVESFVESHCQLYERLLRGDGKTDS